MRIALNSQFLKKSVSVANYNLIHVLMIALPHALEIEQSPFLLLLYAAHFQFFAAQIFPLGKIAILHAKPNVVSERATF